MFKSDREISLVYQGQQGSTQRSMLTVESYIKWYDIYVVSPQGHVSTLSRGIDAEFRRETGGNAWSDHIPGMGFCHWVAERYDFEWDAPSLDMIRGRWAERNES